MEGLFLMLDERITYAVIAIILAVGGLTAVPPIIPERVVEPFSELGVLGPKMKLGDYPSEISVGESFDLFLYVGNHEGRVVYYRTLIKVGGLETNVSDAEPFDAGVIYSVDLVLLDERNMTVPLTLSLSESGVNRRVVFELYQYDSDENRFVYSSEWLQMWLNVTSAGY